MEQTQLYEETLVKKPKNTMQKGFKDKKTHNECKGHGALKKQSKMGSTQDKHA